MQQKKSPAMLIVGLCVVLGAAYFVNATAFFTKPLLPPPAEAPKAPDAAEASAIAKQASERMREQVKKGGGAQAGPEGETVASGIPAEPAIFPPKVQRYNPQYNETSTSGQWYRDDSAVNERGEKVREDRGF